MCLTAPFVETKSTCGAAISTTTTVDGGADDDWKQDENDNDIKKLMLRKMGKPDTLRVLYPTVPYVRSVELSVVQMDSLGICFRSYVW